MLGFFGAGKGSKIEGRNYAAKSVEELEKILEDREFQSADCIQVRSPKTLRGGLKLTGSVRCVKCLRINSIIRGGCQSRSQ